MRKIGLALCAMWITSGIQLAVAAAPLSDGDLENCDVLLGRTRQAAFDSTLDMAKSAAASGNADAIMRYGSILHNKVVCIDEESTGSSGWSVVMSREDGSETEATHAPHADPARIPALAATLREAIRIFERVADTEINARVLLGKYYANYNDYLKEPRKGYLYVASVHDAACRGARQHSSRSSGRCDSLRHDRILYNSLLRPAQRSALDAQARMQADRYPAQTPR